MTAAEQVTAWPDTPAVTLALVPALLPEADVDERPPDADEWFADREHETRRVPWCTCGTWDRLHEPGCGLEPVEEPAW